MLKRAESRTHKNHFWQKKSSPSHLGSFQVDAQPPHMIASSHQNESSLNVFLAISVPARIVIICKRWCVNDISPVVTFLSSLKKGLHLPSWYFFCGLISQSVARTVPMTHPPIVTTGQIPSIHLRHSSPPPSHLQNWPKCTVYEKSNKLFETESSRHLLHS